MSDSTDRYLRRVTQNQDAILKELRAIRRAVEPETEEAPEITRKRERRWTHG